MAWTALRHLDTLVGHAVTFPSDDEAGGPSERELRAYVRRISKLAGRVRGDLEGIRAVASGPKLQAATLNDNEARWLIETGPLVNGKKSVPS